MQGNKHQGREKVLILVKALPHDSKHGETVCCAGVTEDLQWRRQFPIPFRRLSGDQQFQRWQWIEYDWIAPKNDTRFESRRVQQDSIRTLPGLMKAQERASFLDKIVLNSIDEAEQKGQSLALIRPENIKFECIQKNLSDIATERAAYQAAASQGNFLDQDKELAALEPCPYKFSFTFSTLKKHHKMVSADWETAAMYWKYEKLYGKEKAISEMIRIFGVNYPDKGMAFVVGTHSRYKSWILIGVIRLDNMKQMSLF